MEGEKLSKLETELQEQMCFNCEDCMHEYNKRQKITFLKCNRMNRMVEPDFKCEKYQPKKIYYGKITGIEYDREGKLVE